MPLFKLKKTTVIHIGKAGGGTVRAIYEALGIKFKQIHALTKHSFANTKDNVFLVTIRDPVDRFESAFNWRGRLVCRSNDNRERKDHFPETEENIEIFCKKNENIIENRYGLNVNHLAEALCDEEEREYASKIPHIKDSITDYIGDIMKKRGRSKFKFMVLEHGYDFVSQILGALKVAAKIRIEEGESIPENITNHLFNDEAFDFSSLLQHSSKGATFQKISALGSCCVAKYHKKDYELLEHLHEEGGVVCDGRARDECVHALKSIVERRSVYYKSDLGCQEIVGETAFPWVMPTQSPMSESISASVSLTESTSLHPTMSPLNHERSSSTSSIPTKISSTSNTDEIENNASSSSSQTESTSLRPTTNPVSYTNFATSTETPSKSDSNQIAYDPSANPRMPFLPPITHSHSSSSTLVPTGSPIGSISISSSPTFSTNVIEITSTIATHSQFAPPKIITNQFSIFLLIYLSGLLMFVKKLYYR